MDSPLRVAVDVDAWHPSEQAMEAVLGGVLSAEEAARARRFVHDVDRRRAVVGRLLLRRAVAACAGVAAADVPLGRTKAGKPYVRRAALSEEARARLGGAYNVNVSHHGRWVVAADEWDGALVGVDAVRLDELPGRRRAGETLEEETERFFRDLERCFTPREWAAIREGDAAAAVRLRRFHCFWALKESYLKATGAGLGFDLQRVEFGGGKVEDALDRGGEVGVSVDGRPDERWAFCLHRLDERHAAAVAYGPPGDEAEDTGLSGGGGAGRGGVPGRLRTPFEVVRAEDLLDQ